MAKQARATVLRRVVVIQQAMLDWPQVESACRSLLALDRNDASARWTLAFALFRQGRVSEAWSILHLPGGVEISAPDRALFYLELVGREADAITVAQTALDVIRKFPDNEQVHAAAIGAVTTRIDRTELPEAIGRQITEAWASFLRRFPNSTIIEPHALRDSDNPLEDLEPELRAMANAYDVAVDMIRQQTLPIGMLRELTRSSRPYSFILVGVPLGYHFASTIGEQDRSVELEAARMGSRSGCLVDTSALHTLAMLSDLGEAGTLLQIVQSMAVTERALDDLVAGDYALSAPTDGFIRFDTRVGRVVHDVVDSAVLARQRNRVGAMLDVARSCRRIQHPELRHLQPTGVEPEPIWLLAVDAAKEHGRALWADDVGLRRLAHSRQIPTFGTYDLLVLAREQGLLTELQANAVLQRLIQERIVDLPLNQANLLSVAAIQAWRPESVATVLGRPSTWLSPAIALAVLRTALRNSRDEDLVGWCYHALSGFRDALVPECRIEKLVDLSSVIFCHGWGRPAQVHAVAAALKGVAPVESDEILRGVLRTAWERLIAEVSVPTATGVFLRAVSALADHHRQFAVHCILGIHQPTEVRGLLLPSADRAVYSVRSGAGPT